MKDVNLRDYVRVLVKWRRLIVLNVVIITGFAVILSLVLPKRYTSTATLLPPLETSGFPGLGALLGDGYLTGLGRMVGIPGMATTSDVFAAILGSPRVLREVVRRCDLLDLYKTDSVEDAIGALRGKINVEVSPEGMIFVSATAPNPDLAARMATTMVDELDEFNRETAMTMGKRERVFLEERLKEVETLLSDAENDLRDFQEKNRTVSLSEELTQAIEAAALLKAEIVTREIRLNVIMKFATDDNPMVKRLRSEIAEFKEGLHRIEYGKAEKAGESPPEFGAGFSIPFAELPEIALELARLTREAKIQSEIYVLLTQQYEQAKIAEAKDTPTVQILDEALPPERRSYPQRKKMVIVAGILSLFAGIGAAFLLEYVEGLRSRPDEYGDWKEMVGQLYGDLKSLKSMILRR